MKVGTLTLHLPFNYGNALQMLSLHRYLREQGYDAEVLGHWYFPNRAEVLFLHRKVRSLKGLAHVLLDLFTFGGVFCQWRREAKLDAWLMANFRWSEETGATDEFDTDRLPHDAVIVGSDQVWNPIHQTSDFFLLPDFPECIRKIAYAASLGTDRFPPERRAFFAANLKRFAAVSVRESSAVRILRDVADVPATLVCDPTLLHTADEWRDLLGIRAPAAVSSDLVFYFVTPDYRAHWREVLRLARAVRGGGMSTGSASSGRSGLPRSTSIIPCGRFGWPPRTSRSGLSCSRRASGFISRRRRRSSSRVSTARRGLSRTRSTA